MQETLYNPRPHEGGADAPVRDRVRSRSKTRSRITALAYPLLFAIMLLGGYFRFVGLNWDDFTHLHPDERFLTDVAQGLNRRLSLSESNPEVRDAQIAECVARYPDTGGMAPMPAGYFDARCSALNPHNANAGHGLYVYGTLPLFMARGTAELVAIGSEVWTHNVMTRLTGDERWASYEGGQWTSYDGVHLVWRFLSALSEMGVIAIAFIIGRRLHSTPVGLLAAFLYAVTVFSIQMAHFGTADAISNFFAALTLLGAVMVQVRGRTLDYAGFGLAFGFALASRINLAFMVGLLGLAFLVQVMPAFSRRLAAGERERLILRHVFGLVVAGALTLIAFRVFNPYAFTGPGFFGLSLNPRWLQDLSTAQSLVRGDVDSPPNFQWVARTSWWFPFYNIVLWGMGVPLAAAGWAAFGAALYRIVRGRPGALANLLLVAWVAVYFGYMGRQWVMTMRYYLPIYIALIVLAAWGLVSLWGWAQAQARERGGWRALVRVPAFAALAVVPAFSLLWAGMFTNIYRNQLTRVQAGHYVWENLPGDFAMRVIPDDQAALPTARIEADTTLEGEAGVFTADFTAPADGALYRLTADGLRVNPPEAGASGGTLRITLERPDAGANPDGLPREAVLATLNIAPARAGAFEGVEPAPGTLDFILDPLHTVRAGEPLRLRAEVFGGATAELGVFGVPVQPQRQPEFVALPTPLISIPIANNNYGGGTPEDLLSRVTRFDETTFPDSFDTFMAPATGTITTMRAPHLGDLLDTPDAEVLDIRIADENGVTLATARVDQHLPRTTSITGDAVDLVLDRALRVEQGRRYSFFVTRVRGSIVSGGALFTWEGAWDDPIPTKVCTLPPGISLYDQPPPGLIMDGRECNGRDPWWGLVTGYEQNIVYEDDEAKRENLIRSLENSDYIGISSNRFYDTLSRNPLRWPLTNQYYRWLFGGELGYELVATFQETFELGPLRVSDQHLPTYDSPAWLNELESEEAFSVYDHPVVFIFRKRSDYDAARVRAMLESVPITPVMEGRVFANCPEDPDQYFCDTTLVSLERSLPSEEANLAPTQLMFTPEQRAVQQSGGTWADRFDADSPVNTDPALTVAVWWFGVTAFGLAAFPLLAALFPALADRGWAMARFTGMFLAAWITWFLASARVPVWTQAGIAAALVAIAVLGVVLLARRGDFGVWLRDGWKRLLVVELLTLVLFASFLAIRLTNPDLWVTGFGGEKPMDFAYFNGVLRSTVFPPIDPWYAGGFINYYYFGFVIVGAPTLLLGIVPSIAYNLILPTLFAAVGMGAFSVAYSLVYHWRERHPADGGGRLRRLGSPLVAGVAALIMAVYLGNLDTPRVALGGLASLGGYQQPRGLLEFLIDEYESQNAVVADDVYGQLQARAAENNLVDRVRYELSNSASLVSSIGRGFVAMLNGAQPYIGADRWFWGPSRVLAETPGVEGSAITEMPFFTFIYGDLHAHMIAMPLQLLALGFIANEVLLAGSDTRRRGARSLALALGGAAVGMLRATNTWDWITYMILGAAGLSFAVWLSLRANRTPIVSRAALLAFVGVVGGFLLASFIAVFPYTSWFVTTYSSVRPWTDGKTPLWAYFIIHGLFLFLITSLLVWDTVRWLRGVLVRSLRGTLALVLALGIVVVTLLAASLVLAAVGYQVTLLALPLLVWVAALFFRTGQTRPMQCVLAFAGLALGLTLGVEYVVLDGDIGRQNTVFKFYMQVWLLFSVCGGVAFALLWRSLERWKPGLRTVWTFALVVLVAIASLFPIMATQGKRVFRMEPDMPFTIDGMAFMRYGQVHEGDSQNIAADPTLLPIPLEEDYAMIRWLQDNVTGTPTIIEGLADDTQYRWNSRIAIYTGLPAVVGWNFHQRQQRTPDPLGRMVEMRNANVNAFYETASISTAWEMLRWYDVTFVIVGRYERAYANPAGIAKFARMAELGLLEPVFTQGQSTIYRVARERFFDQRVFAMMTEQG
jgi:YYY domain-containing protein